MLSNRVFQTALPISEIFLVPFSLSFSESTQQLLLVFVCLLGWCSTYKRAFSCTVPYEPNALFLVTFIDKLLTRTCQNDEDGYLTFPNAPVFREFPRSQGHTFFSTCIVTHRCIIDHIVEMVRPSSGYIRV